MKLTKSQLKQLIKEELQNVLNEQRGRLAGRFFKGWAKKKCLAKNKEQHDDIWEWKDGNCAKKAKVAPDWPS